VLPLSNLLATGQIELGDLVTIDFDPESCKLKFIREDRGALVGATAEKLRDPKGGLAFRSGAGGSVSKALVHRVMERERLVS
jgi:hypothetical protein